MAGREVAPTTGTPHIQGFVNFPDRLRPLSLGLPKEIHWEKQRGSKKQNMAYCGKDQNYVFPREGPLKRRTAYAPVPPAKARAIVPTFRTRSSKLELSEEPLTPANDDATHSGGGPDPEGLQNRQSQLTGARIFPAAPAPPPQLFHRPLAAPWRPRSPSWPRCFSFCRMARAGNR
eukprot:scaffold11793_cov138-Isochrysis_galbana.AAC.1